MPLEVLHCDNHLLAVSKPAGMPCVPDESGDESLLDAAREWVRVEFSKPGNVFLGVVHRLDRPVSGVVLFARTSKAASRLTEQFKTRSTEKHYLGVVQGHPAEESGELQQWLEKLEDRNRVIRQGGPGPRAKEAVTRWRVIAQDSTRSLIRFVPLTGRSHQLRVAAATLGTPLLGDLKYGAKKPLADKSIALHAETLEVSHPTKDERVAVGCAPPREAWWDLARPRGAQ